MNCDLPLWARAPREPQRPWREDYEEKLRAEAVAWAKSHRDVLTRLPALHPAGWRRPAQVESVRTVWCYSTETGELQRPFYVERGDKEAILEWWRYRAVNAGEDPDMLARQRNHRRDLASVIIAELVEAGAYGTDIASALGIGRTRVSERLSEARHILGREIVRRRKPEKSRTVIEPRRRGERPPADNSVWSALDPDGRNRVWAEHRQQIRDEPGWWRQTIIVDGRRLRADPYVEEGRPTVRFDDPLTVANPDTFHVPISREEIPMRVISLKEFRSSFLSPSSQPHSEPKEAA